MKKRFFARAALLLFALFFCFSSSAAASTDPNGDGKTNIADVLCVLRAVTAPQTDGAADINGDGKTDLADALLLLRQILDRGDLRSYSYTDIVGRLTDTKYLSLGESGEKSLLASSYDRTSVYENGHYVGWRANGDGGKTLGETADGGQLLADITGAGYISRIWTATAGPGHVKIYIDGESEPTVDLAFSDYFSRKAYPFVYTNLVYADTAEGKNCYLPITFSTSCRVIGYGGFGEDGWGKYYHINYTLFPGGVTVERMPKQFSAEQAEALRLANVRLGGVGEHPDGCADAPFETAVVSKTRPFVKTLSGKGAISGLLVRVDSLADAYAVSKEAVDTLKNLRIKIYWDGADTPAVNTPLGDFFASGFGFDEVATLLLGVRDDRTLYNYYFMPYQTGAKIVIYTVGQDEARVSLALNTVENPYSAEETLYFGTQFTEGEYHEGALDANGKYDPNGERSPDDRFLKISGAGRLVGLTLHHNKLIGGVDPLSSPGSPWWGEGDEKFFVDGEDFPSWFGTGTEDFFGFAWCSPTWFSKPYHAQSYCESGSGGVGSRVLTRLLLTNAVAFHTGFEGYLEKYYSDAYCKYAFTSYFYLAKGSRTVDTAYADDQPLTYYKPQSEGAYLIEGEDLYVHRYLPQSGEQLAVAASHIDHQKMDNYGPNFSGGYQVIALGLGKTGAVEFNLPAPGSGRYMLLASFTNAPDFTIVQASVNGKNVGAPVDTYGTSVSANLITELGEVTLSGDGSDILRLTNTGKNAAVSSNLYRFAVDFLLLVPADAYTGLANLDLSAYTDVQRMNTKQTAPDGGIYRLEGETDLLATAKASSGTPKAQTMTAYNGTWSENAQLFLYNSKNSPAVTLTVYVYAAEAGVYRLDGGFTCAKDYGKFALSVNGTKVTSFDFYQPRVCHTEAAAYDIALEAGYNKLVFTCEGKNDASVGYCLGIDVLQFTKMNGSH